jgi:hypothetical protein
MKRFLHYVTKRTLAVGVLALLATIHCIVPSRLALDWPTVAVLGVALLLFVGPEVEYFLPFIKKFKLGSAEVELIERSATQLAIAVEKSEESEVEDQNPKKQLTIVTLERDLQHNVDALVSNPPYAGEAQRFSRILDTDIESQILDLASRDKQAAILRLAVEIEREIFLLHGVLGLRSRRSKPAYMARMALEELAKHGTISGELFTGLIDFWKVKNLLAHARFSMREETPVFSSTLDSGIRLLRLLKAIPRPVYRVHRPKVVLFSDAQCTRQIADLFGVILEITQPDGRQDRHIYPAGKEFTKGELVGWDWDMSNVYDETFYLNDKGEPTKAWDESATFIGKTLII